MKNNITYNETKLNINLLDKIRVESGSESMKIFFEDLLKENTKYAEALINDTELTFTSLLFLKSIIKNNNFFYRLNTRNILSLQIIDEIEKGSKFLLVPENLPKEYIILIVLSLKWIVATGLKIEENQKEYIRILDMCVILLTKIYKDKTILPIIVKSIFERHRNDYPIYDLLWAFFHIRDPQSLVLIAEYFYSDYEEDVNLANKLLTSITNINFCDLKNYHYKYLAFINWLNENMHFLLFTGESFQKRGNPQPYVVILEAKYLCKPVSINTGKSLLPLNEYEKKLIRIFNNLDTITKQLLASYSYRQFCKSYIDWSKWINCPIPQQIHIAKNGGFD